MNITTLDPEEIVLVPTESPIEPITPILPTQAIKLGRLSHPNVTPNKFYDGGLGACTLTAMAIGWGWKRSKRELFDPIAFIASHIRKTFPRMPLYGRNLYWTYTFCSRS